MDGPRSSAPAEDGFVAVLCRRLCRDRNEPFDHTGFLSRTVHNLAHCSGLGSAPSAVLDAPSPGTPRKSRRIFSSAILLLRPYARLSGSQDCFSFRETEWALPTSTGETTLRPVCSSDSHPSAALRYACTVSRAVRCQENSPALFRPAVESFCRKSGSSWRRRIAPAISCGEHGSTRIAASPQISGRLVEFEAISGVPVANASTAGRPKPSHRDGNTAKSAARYSGGRSSWGT
jgi:hypothetical protein